MDFTTKEGFVAACTRSGGFGCALMRIARVNNDTSSDLVEVARNAGLSEVVAWGIMSGWDHGHAYYPHDGEEHGVYKTEEYKRGLEWGIAAFHACGGRRREEVE